MFKFCLLCADIYRSGLKGQSSVIGIATIGNPSAAGPSLKRPGPGRPAEKTTGPKVAKLTPSSQPVPSKIVIEDAI